MTVELIETFLKLVEIKNFTRAAEELYISQSALSHRLNLLEDEVGLKLIDRSRGNRGLSLTQAGIEFIEIANRWSNLSQETRNFQSDYRQRRLSIASIESIAFILAPLYKDWVFQNSASTKTSLDIHVFPSLQIIEAIENLDIDIGFTALQRAGKHLQIEPIFREKHYLVGNLENEGHIIDPEILDPDMEILTNWSSDYLSWHDYYLGSPKRALASVNTAILAIPFLDKGAWCVVPSGTISFLKHNCLVHNHSIKVYEIKNPPPDRICYKITNSFPRANRIDNIRYLESALKKFLEHYHLHL